MASILATPFSVMDCDELACKYQDIIIIIIIVIILLGTNLIAGLLLLLGLTGRRNDWSSWVGVEARNGMHGCWDDEGVYFKIAHV